MAADNRISIEITPAKKAAIEAAINTLKTELRDVTQSLSADERESLPRIADKTIAFDEKCETYMASRPDLVPGFIDAAERAKDRKLIADLLPSLRELAPLVQALEDTLALANSDNYMGDLSFYQNVKQAAKRGVTGAAAIYDDLKQRFPGRPRGNGDGTPPVNP